MAEELKQGTKDEWKEGGNYSMKFRQAVRLRRGGFDQNMA